MGATRIDFDTLDALGEIKQDRLDDRLNLLTFIGRHSVLAWLTLLAAEFVANTLFTLSLIYWLD